MKMPLFMPFLRNPKPTLAAVLQMLLRHLQRLRKLASCDGTADRIVDLALGHRAVHANQRLYGQLGNRLSHVGLMIWPHKTVEVARRITPFLPLSCG